MFDFPNDPSVNQTTQGPNGTCWTWDGEKWVGGAVGPWLSIWGGTMFGELKLDFTPSDPLDAVNKQYVDNLIHNQFFDAPMDGQTYALLLNNWTPVVPITGALMRGPINMMGFQLTGLPPPVAQTDAATKEYVDSIISGDIAGEFGVYYGSLPPATPLLGMVWTTPEGNMFAWTGALWLQVAGLDILGGGGGTGTGAQWSFFSPLPPTGADRTQGVQWTNAVGDNFIWTGSTWLQLNGGIAGGGGGGAGLQWSFYSAFAPTGADRVTGVIWTDIAGNQFIWTGSLWLQVNGGVAGGGGGPGGANVSVGATPPAAPAQGDLWFDSVGTQLFIWFDDGLTGQWVIAVTDPGGLPTTGGTITGDLEVTGDIVTDTVQIGGSAGPNWTAGTGAPTFAGVTGSIYSQTDGVMGSVLYVCDGGTSWSPIA